MLHNILTKYMHTVPWRRALVSQLRGQKCVVSSWSQAGTGPTTSMVKKGDWSSLWGPEVLAKKPTEF